MDHLPMSWSDPQRIQGVKDSRVRVKCLKILKNENYGRKTTMDYIRILYISGSSPKELE